jgi:hypothetical protein
MTRSNLPCRWILTWQDIFLSFTYDRPSFSANPKCPAPDISPARNGLAECIIALCQVVQERADRLRSSAIITEDDHLQMTLSYKHRFEQILDKAAPFLTQKIYCRSLKDHLERLALRIHVGYCICRIIRFHLQNTNPGRGSHTINQPFPLPGVFLESNRSR